MVVLYTSLLLLLTGASVLTRRRAASLEKKYTAVLKEANTLLREPPREGNSNRADPYQTGGPHDQFSPILYANKIKTPTLIIHGAEDNIVPVGQGYELFRALKDRGVTTELVIYPRERHRPLELMLFDFLKARMRRGRRPGRRLGPGAGAGRGSPR